jgi:phosphoglycerol geranylgeranyltransferase
MRGNYCTVGMRNKVETRLKKCKKGGKTAIFLLVDSENLNSTSNAEKTAKELLRASKKMKNLFPVILVGGSSATDQIGMDKAVRILRKKTKMPIVLFPGNITGVVPKAHAILFTSLMNSENPYYITQAQALGAPLVRKFELEALPTAYLVIGDGTSAWFFGNVRGIPFDKPKIAAAYAMAAQYLGMRFVYLEAGSGAKQSVTPEMVATVRKVFDGFIIVGGGIKAAKIANSIIRAGADGLVIGTLLEQTNGLKKFTEMVKSIKK